MVVAEVVKLGVPEVLSEQEVFENKCFQIATKHAMILEAQ